MTPIFLVATLATLLVWQPVIMTTRRFLPWIHGLQVGYANGFLLLLLRLVGARIVIERLGEPLPEGPAVIVSNHQSFYDIPLILWTFRARFPRFVAKKELERGVPSVSNVLREDGSALIDRGNPRQAIDAIKALGTGVKTHGWTACIFPEGTRSRDGRVKRFKPAGLVTLLGETPGVPVIPVTIDGSWEIMRYGFRPVPFGVRIRVRVHPPLGRETDDSEVVERAEEIIRRDLTT
jgi:1-acyl-sn-glycerol-3-phosphate acyltransferase